MGTGIRYFQEDNIAVTDHHTVHREKLGVGAQLKRH